MAGEEVGAVVKVAFIIQTYHPVVGGSERQLQKLLPRLVASGIDPLVVTRGLPGEPGMDQVDGVRVLRVGSVRQGALGSALFLFGALRILHRERPDVVHAFSLMTPASIGSIHRLITGVPMVVKALRGGVKGDLDRIRRKPFYRLRCRVLRRTVAAAQVISDEIDQEFADIGIASERRHRVCNGVDVAALAASVSGTGMRASLGINAHDPVFVYVGRLIAEKRIDLLITAFGHVRKQHRLARLLIVGDGPERKNIEARATAHSGIIAYGQTDDIASVLALATVFVQPSSTEGMSNSLLEAMAVGLPIVATQVGAARELLGDCERGWLIAAGDELALRQGMLEALDASAPIRGERARRFVARHYDLQQTAEKLDRVYRTLVPGLAGVSQDGGCVVP